MSFLRALLGLVLPFMATGINLPLSFMGKPGLAVCGEFAEFRTCGPACPPTCDSLRETVCCEVACTRGCFCRDGYILEKEPRMGPRKCIPVHQCPSPGVLSFDHPTLSVLEGSGKAIISVVRRNGSHSPVSCRYRVVGPQGPYADLTGLLTFPDGVVTRDIEISLQDNAIRNPDLTVRVELFEPSRKTDIVGGTFILTILDDDMTPGYLELETTQASVFENSGTVDFNVVRREGSDGQLRVRYRTVPDSAFTNADFSPVTGELVFEEGETRKTVSVFLVDDDVREASEKFRFELFDFTPGPGVLNFRRRESVISADVTILDNDMRPGILQFQQIAQEVQEDSRIVELAVVRLEGQDGEIRAKFETRPKTAQAGQDFEHQVGEIVFKEGERRKTIRIKIQDDTVLEPEESFEVVLFDPTPGPDTINFRGLGAIHGITITIIDDDMNPGVLQLEQGTYEVMEDVGSARVDVVRSGGQDGRIVVQYLTRGLTARENRDFVPTSGEIVFEEGETRKSILVEITDDAEKEGDETVEVQLLNATPGPGIVHFRGFGPIEKAIIKIRDNDMTPGILLLERATYEVFEDAGTFHVNVLRLDGTDGQIRVLYRTVSNTATAGQDFEGVSGELVFEAGEMRKTIDIPIINDAITEPAKLFEIHLTNPTAGSGVLNFRGLGHIAVAEITIKDDDMRPGILQFDQPSYEVLERIGTLKVAVVRLRGSDGEIRVKYRTADHTAAANRDFVHAEGELVFGEGETRKEIAVTILDDEVWEPSKLFVVQLLDPTPGLEVINFEGLGPITTTEVKIMDDDMKPGSFQLERASYEFPENAGTIKIGVLRVEGTDGEIRVKYRTVPKTAAVSRDFSPAEGELVFGDKESRKDISVALVDDDVREAVETFEVELFEPSHGAEVLNFRRFTSNPKAVVSITDDDMRAGILQLESPTYEVLENAGVATVAVVRLDGADGEIRVQYRTVSRTALASQDFAHDEGEIIFREGERRKDVAIRILDDDVREPEETFEVQLSKPRAALGVVNFKGLGSQTSTVVTIKDDDMKPGVLQLDEAVYQFFENDGTVRIPVVRVNGSDGQIRVFYHTAPGTALAGVDFAFSSGELVFRDGETEKFIEIEMVNDHVREEVESFVVELTDPQAVQGILNFKGLGHRHTAEVFILDDDMNPGFLEIEHNSYSVLENAGQLRIGVIRLDGQHGQVRVRYQTVPRTAAAHTDFLPAEGEVVFEEGEDRKFIEISILNDIEKERAETFEVQILHATAGHGIINFRGLGQKTSATVTIQDDDSIPGILEVERPTYFAREDAGTVQVVVVRRGGADGPIRCHYQSRPKSAAAGADFVATQGELVFEDGERSRTIAVQIVDDRLREPRESFEIVLMEANRGQERVVGQNHIAEIFINDDDMTPGFLELEETSYEVLENAGTLKVAVRRVDGSDGQIRVGYVTSPKSARPDSDFIPIEGELVFEEGETRKEVPIRIRNDDQKEPAEEFEFQLVFSDAALDFRKPGQKQGAIITINDDDWNAGFFELEQPSYDVVEKAGSVSVGVIRVGGSDGRVRIGYQTVPQTAHPSSDFQATSGELIFEDGETRRTILVPIVNDGVRESSETFEIRLLDAAPSQGFLNPKGVSHQKRTAVVTIFDDDGNPGFLEMEEPTYVVSEGIRELQVVVHRRGGSDGRIACRYQTTARSALAGIDFESGSGVLVFEDGETRKSVKIHIIDDHIKESVKSFEVLLLDPLPAPGILNTRVVGSKKRTLITIADDDTNPGLVQLEMSSFTVPESVGILPVPIIRVNGSDGQIRVWYRTVPKTAHEGVDFASQSGEIVFKDGESRKTIELHIHNDDLKEPAESFELQLFDATPGPGVLNFRGLGFIPGAEIIIQDDDMRHGFLELESPSYHFAENSGTATIGVIRLDGTDGRIHVRYQTTPQTAIPGKDYIDASGELIFEEGEKRKEFTVKILNDERREATKTFEVHLSATSIDGEDATFRALGSRRTSLVSIWDDDQSPGVFQFRENQVSVREESSKVSLTIVRSDGTDGPVSVRVRAVDGSARSTEDYVLPTSLVTFGEGEREKTVDVGIVDDHLPESAENFQVGLFDPTNGAVLGQNSVFTVTILDNDGFVERPSVPVSRGTQVFFSQSAVTFPSGSKKAFFKVRREGDWIPLTVQMETLDGTARGGVDYRRTRGNITFQSKDIELTVELNLIDNPNRLETRSFMVRIYEPTSGVVVRGKDILTIFLEAPPATSLSLRQRFKLPRGQQDCAPGLLFNPCLFGCPQVCNLVSDLPDCRRACSPACVCPDGLILKSLQSSECVPRSQCPRNSGTGGGRILVNGQVNVEGLLGGGNTGGALGGLNLGGVLGGVNVGELLGGGKTRGVLGGVNAGEILGGGNTRGVLGGVNAEELLGGGNTRGVLGGANAGDLLGGGNTRGVLGGSNAGGPLGGGNTGRLNVGGVLGGSSGSGHTSSSARVKVERQSSVSGGGGLFGSGLLGSGGSGGGGLFGGLGLG